MELTKELTKRPGMTGRHSIWLYAVRQLCIAILLACGLAAASLAQTTAFTYQGRLNDGSAPANGQYDFEFRLFNAQILGSQEGTTQTLTNVKVVGGIFTVVLDFGPTPFSAGADRWLEISVKKPTDSSFTILLPRQKITSTPYATNAANLGGQPASSYVLTSTNDFVRNQTSQQNANLNITGNGLFGGTLSADNFNVSGNGTLGGNLSALRFIGNGAMLTNLNASNITSGTLDSARLDVVPINKGGTGSTTQNFVDLTTTQSISGLKIFNSPISTGGVALNDNTLILRGFGDNNHRIFYNPLTDGMNFNTYSGTFLWRKSSEDINLMQLGGNTGNLAIRGSYNQLSDARFKANVRTFGNALDVVRRLRGVAFNWKPERSDNPNLQIGFIAQEVETVLPEVVTTDMDGYKSVSYANIVPVLVEAIKQQQTQIEAQTRQINEQARQIEALRAAFCQANAQSAFCKAN